MDYILIGITLLVVMIASCFDKLKVKVKPCTYIDVSNLSDSSDTDEYDDSIYILEKLKNNCSTILSIVGECFKVNMTDHVSETTKNLTIIALTVNNIEKTIQDLYYNLKD
jgi:hypothetical protein